MLLAVHLICVNVASAGPVVCAWLDWRSECAVARRAAKFLATVSFALLLLGSVIGVAVASLLWNDAYRDLLHVFQYKITWGVQELLFSVVLLALYAIAVWISPTRRFAWRLLRASVAILAATNLLYHFPTLFLVMSEVQAGHLDRPAAITADNFRDLMTQGFIVARAVHFWLASFAVTGVSLICFARWIQRTADETEAAARVAVWGARIALVPTLLQILVGVWVLSVLPPVEQQRLLGSDLIAASLLGASLITALWLMHQLSSVAMGETSPRALSIVIGTTVVVVVLMTAAARRASSEQQNTTSYILEIDRGD